MEHSIDFGAKVIQVLRGVGDLVDEELLVPTGHQLGVVACWRPTVTARGVEVWVVKTTKVQL